MIWNLAGQYSRIYNNYIYGPAETGMLVSADDTVKNNVITNITTGININSGQTDPAAGYNDLWRTTYPYLGFTGDSTNLLVDPMIVNDDPSQGDPDFHLQMFSPLIDAGDAAVYDKDGSRSDISGTLPRVLTYTRYWCGTHGTALCLWMPAR